MLHIQKENSETIVPTKEYSAADMNSYLFPLIYEEGSHNNKFTIIFKIGDVQYKSAPYYFDYKHHEDAKKLDLNESLTLYPSL